jgi:hypothetical protein
MLHTYKYIMMRDHKSMMLFFLKFIALRERK